MSETTQEFLDQSQYQTDAILRYERVYGEDFVSPGGKPMARELIASMGLAPDARVLDVGCGLGGGAFVMAREFGLRVDAIDLSKNMLALAQSKLEAHGLAERVKLEWGDCLQLQREQRYDAIYSRDVFLHIEDKTRLFAVLAASLRAGGQLLFTDYCCGPKPWSDAFADYVADRGYSLHTVDDYAALIALAGFDQVGARDMSDRFGEILRADIERIALLDLDPRQRLELEASWRAKLERTGSGDHRWGLFTAVKE